jgi:hypothetical protein
MKKLSKEKGGLIITGSTMDMYCILTDSKSRKILDLVEYINSNNDK